MTAIESNSPPTDAKLVSDAKREASLLFRIALGAAIAGLILSEIPWGLSKILGAFAYLGALWSFAKGCWELVLVLVLDAEPRYRTLLQTSIVFVVWLLPFLLYFSNTDGSFLTTLRAIATPFQLGATIFLGAAAYFVAEQVRPQVPARAFIGGVLVAAALAFSIRENIRFSTEDDDYASEPSPIPSADRAMVRYVIDSAALLSGVALSFSRRPSREPIHPMET